MEPPIDPEEMVACPYDPVHMFKSKRLIYHLEKCRKNHPTSDFRKCDFNASHIIPTPELSFHLRTCPDRGRLELEVFHENHQYKQKGDTSLPQCDWTPPEASESWDDDNVRFEPKLNEQLFEEEATKIKISQAKPSKKPPSPEKWRMPHSLPMTGPIRMSGGRGRGRGITKKLVEAKTTPSGLQKIGGSPAGVVEQSSHSGLGQFHSGSLSGGQPHPVSLLSHETEQLSLSGQPSPFSLSQGQPHSVSSQMMGPPSLPPGLGQPGSVMSQSSLSQAQLQSMGLGQPHSGSVMSQSSLSQAQLQSMGVGQPHSGSVMSQSSLPRPPGLAHPSLSQPVFNGFGTNGQPPAGRGLAQPHGIYPMALSQNPFVPPGLGTGNGYGRGALCFGRGKVPLPTHTARHTATVNGTALNGQTHFKSAGINNVQSSPPVPVPSVEEMERKEENEEEIRKRKNIRKLKKALRQVEELELKQKSGVILTPEQFIKLNRKADLLSKLREVETDEVE